MNLPTAIRVHAPGMPPVIKTVEQALQMIELHLPPELQRLSRWTFARALLVETLRTGKTKDLRIASRQLRQVLSNEKWLQPDERAS